MADAIEIARSLMLDLIGADKRDVERHVRPMRQLRQAAEASDGRKPTPQMRAFQANQHRVLSSQEARSPQQSWLLADLSRPAIWPMSLEGPVMLVL